MMQIGQAVQFYDVVFQRHYTGVVVGVDQYSVWSETRFLIKWDDGHRDTWVAESRLEEPAL